MPRDLKDPDGCRFSSLRCIWHPASFDRRVEWFNGVFLQGHGSVGDRCDEVMMPQAFVRIGVKESRR
jgi:hypothetical protein